jgi:hypothetical protein
VFSLVTASIAEFESMVSASQVVGAVLQTRAAILGRSLEFDVIGVDVSRSLTDLGWFRPL